MAPFRPLKPTQLQIICRNPRCIDFQGEEWGDVRILVRVIACASGAAFPAAAQLISLWSPVVGFIDPSSGSDASSNLIEWGEIIHFSRDEDFARAAVGPRPISTPGAQLRIIRFPPSHGDYPMVRFYDASAVRGRVFLLPLAAHLRDLCGGPHISAVLAPTLAALRRRVMKLRIGI